MKTGLEAGWFPDEEFVILKLALIEFISLGKFGQSGRHKYRVALFDLQVAKFCVAVYLELG